VFINFMMFFLLKVFGGNNEVFPATAER
jgi:hypothetical protein